MSKMKYRLPLFITAACILAACTPTQSVRGNLLKPEQVEKVKVGEYSRSQVLRLLGSPTTTSPFDPNIWYYIGQQMEKRGILDPEVTDEQIYVAKFDEDGILQSFEVTDQDRLEITINEDRTPTYGNEVTVIQQLFGNIGRFNAPGQP